ncbi:hypothetical protein C8R47DRAFT_1160841 [Mycena vitilis]|nr:hypothetical protein C8R47DRAFT_1160841 [Mycena vitilis]
MHPIVLAELSTAETAEGPAHDFFLSYPYLVVWTDQVDVWRFFDSLDPTHVTTLDLYVEKLSFGPIPVIDHARRLLIIRDSIRTSMLRVFSLHDGELVRSIDLERFLATEAIHYRQEDGHALVLLDRNYMPGDRKTSIVEVDMTGSTGPDPVKVVSLVGLPPHLKDLEDLYLPPIFFGKDGDIITTWTTDWRDKVDLLHWHAWPNDLSCLQLSRTRELLPSRKSCKAMQPTRHLAVDDSTLIMCIHEKADHLIAEKTSVRALNTANLAVRWTAKPIPGQVESLHHIPSLGVLVLSSCHNITNLYESREHFQLRTVVVVLDARTGKRRAMDTIDSDAQRSCVVNSYVIPGFVVDLFVASDEDNPVIGLVWNNGDTLVIGVNEFIANGFEREGEGEKVRTVALFPAAVTVAAMGRREIIAIAGVKKHEIISEGGREEDILEWEEEEGKVMFAKW